MRFKSAGNRSVMRERLGIFLLGDRGGEARGAVGERQVRMAPRERTSEKGVLIKE